MEVELPDTALTQVEDSTFNTRPSDDIEADLVLVLGPPRDPAHAIIVEIQQDKSKHPRQLARYAAALWLMLGCDVTVLVICPNRNVADYYAQPVESGLTGYRLRPCVLGPDAIPAITDPRQAVKHLDMAAMSIMAHGRDRKVVEAFATALTVTDDDHASDYYDYAYSMAAPEIRRLMEEIMTSTTRLPHSPFLREQFNRGETKGKAEEAARSVLLVLAARRFDVPDDIRARITACTDLSQLETWLTRAATAQNLEGLFHEG